MDQQLFTCTFTNECFKFTDQIVERIIKPRSWFPRGNLYYYPDIGDWAQKVYQELRGETKRAVIAVINQRVVGVIIFQRDKVNKDILELKHLSVGDFFAGRRIASFLLRQAEIEGTREFQSKKIRCDVKAELIGVQQFLLANRYQLISLTDLYGLKAGADAIFEKRRELIKKLIVY